MRPVVGVCAAWLVACTAPTLLPDSGVAGDGSVDHEAELAARALELRNCPGNDAFGVGGVYVVRFVTSSVVSDGDGVSNQDERTTRFGVAQLCVDQRDVGADLLVCALEVGPIFDEGAASCAAEAPGSALLAALPIAHFNGAISVDGGDVSLARWIELWGLRDDATLPAEPDGIEQAEPDGTFDQDRDRHPGVTLRGTGNVPTTSYVARVTVVDFQLEKRRGPDMSGVSGAVTEEIVLGGPATRLLRPRERANGEQQDALFVRADGLLGSDDVGVADGKVTCAEVQAWLAEERLPAAAAGVCEIPEAAPQPDGGVR